MSLNVIKNIVSAEKLLKQADLMRYCQIKNISINEDEKINKPKIKQPIEKISALDVKTEQHLDQLLRGFNHLRIIRLDIRASNFWWSKTNIWPKVNLIFQLYLLKQKYPEKNFAEIAKMQGIRMDNSYLNYFEYLAKNLS